MSLVRGAWKILVGVKDALVLCLLLLFFALLWAALSARPNAAAVTPGALLVDLDGALVEQPEEADTLAVLSGAPVLRQHRLRDVVHAIESAAKDDRIKAVVLDLDGFTGGGQAAVQRAAEALDTVRAAKKPVFAFATGYTDDAYQLAAHASEIWLDPMGLTLFTGPGGSNLYFKGLIDRLGVTTKVYRVGTYKSFVEPFTRADQSPEAEEADRALAGALWQTWQDSVSKARPEARLAGFIAEPQAAVQAAGGDLAKAALDAGLVDKLGDRIAFGERVAEVVGADSDGVAGSFKHTELASWIAAKPLPAGGNIGVITIAGEIVDGEAMPGTAGGDTISTLLLEGLAEKDLKALVVRVDSPGGSVLASEKIRQAILQAKARKLPVVISMGSVAASGGYWVATPGDVIFAEPSTVTGSIGVFGIIPTFEDTLGKIGITTDGVTTTPLSGQPDILGGTSPAFDAIIQSSVENTYSRFIGLVAEARGKSPAEVDRIAQGRVWDGGTARQLGLVDRFGSLDDAIAEAARRAKLDPETARPEFLETPPSLTATLIESWLREDEEASESAGLLSTMARARFATLLRAFEDARSIAAGPVVRAQCLTCPRDLGALPANRASLMAKLIEWMGR